ncbi:MAG TPA: methyltransferase domain-containing protein, partial [Stellaceae bacterium]|nr:methyltransferase domain-containing protein [Stellaceae bacterium]
IGTRSAAADIVLFDTGGEIVDELSDCWFRRVALSRRDPVEDSVLRFDLVPAPLEEGPSPAALGQIADIVGRHADLPADAVARNREQSLLFDALAGAIARQAVLTVVDADVPFATDELLDAGTLSGAAAGLFDALLTALAGLGEASQTGPLWRIAAQSELPAPEELWRLLLAEAPELGAELAVTAAALDELPSRLSRGLRTAGAPLPMLEALRRGSPVSAAGIEIVCAALGEIAASWPAERPLRVLEIGADSAATLRVITQLARSGAALLYRATDPDPDAAARLAPLVAGFAGTSIGCWPPRNPADADGDARFDIVLSLHATARVPLTDAALESLREVLAPGGLFIAAEAAPNALWDLAFDSPAGHLRPAGEWRDALAVAGFDCVGAVPLVGAWPSTIAWGQKPSFDEATAQMPARCPVLLIAAGERPPGELREGLTLAGHLVSGIDADAFAGDQDDGGVGDSDGAVAVLVIEEDDDPVGQASRSIALTASVAAAAARRQMPLWLVTAGAQHAGDGENSGLVGAALWGFGRVLVNEVPRLVLRLVDFPPALGWAERAERLAAELEAASEESEIVWTALGRHAPRFRRGLPPRWAAPADAIALADAASGGIDALGWQKTAPRPPGPGEVSIEVEAAALNFRDLMWAMGLLPEEALIDGFAGPTFGLECAGRISAIGAGVDRLKIGDRVAGLAPAALASRVTTLADAVTPIRPGMTFAAAATAPVAFVTALYALDTLGRLSPGEIVLIHAAAGGVGLAAVQVAR